MLPVVKRKTLEVPHGLAAIAAAICLVLAFATDVSDPDAARIADIEDVKATELVVGAKAAVSDDNTVRSDSSSRHGSDSSSGTQTSTLITWFGLRR
jgi:hypothetical protein